MALNQYLTGAVITSVIMVCIFAFVSVSVWAENRRREREAFYRSEVLKKLADSSGGQAQQVIDLMREQERNDERKRREGGRLAGVIVTGVGIGLSAMFKLLAPGTAWAIGLIPLLIGLALLVYNYGLAPRQEGGAG